MKQIVEKLRTLPVVALAQETPPSPITSPGGLVAVLERVSGWMFTIFLSLAVVFILWSAFLYLTAAGNSDKLGSAKNTFIYAVIATVVALIAGGVTAFVRGFIGA